MVDRGGPPVVIREELGLTNGRVGGLDAIDGVPRDFPPATPFPVDAMPGPCTRLIWEAAAAIGSPPDLVAVPMLVTLGSAIGNARWVKLKGGWEENAILFAAAVAEPGEKKTPAAKVALDPAVKKQIEYRNEYRRKLRAFEQEAEDEPPVMDRTFVDDTTVEALVRTLESAPRGLMVSKDELSGWVRSMDQYKSGGKGADRQFWLSAWSKSPVAVDRKSMPEPVMLPHPFVSVYGTIQPSILPELREGREDGMLDRFLFSYPEPSRSRWTDDEISASAVEGYRDLYEKLRDLNMPTDDQGDPDPVRVAFSPEAKEILKRAINDLRERMERPGFPARLKWPYSKLEAYIARLCLILATARAVAEGQPERIAPEDVISAVKLVDYFADHVRRVFTGLYGEDPIDRLAEDLAKFLRERGGRWDGQPAELHRQLESGYKPERPDELSKYLKAIAKRAPGLAYSSEPRWVPELGNNRRFVTISLTNAVNAVNGTR